MSDSEEETFEKADAGASMVAPVQAGSIRKGAFVVINGFPCKVVDTATSKTGKHGHAKVVITALDIFTGKKMETMSPTTHNLEQPTVTRKTYTLINLDGNIAHLMLDDGSTKEDLNIEDPDLLASAEKLLEADGEAVVEVLNAMGKEQIMMVKKSSENK